MFLAHLPAGYILTNYLQKKAEYQSLSLGRVSGQHFT